MITLINVFTVEPASQQRLVDLLARATDEFVSRAPGFLSATLHRSLEGSKVTMYAQWRSVEDYEAMRRDPRPLPFLQEALTIARFEPGMYEIVRQFSPAGNSGPAAMTEAELSGLYRAYLACLNAQDWTRLGQFVHDEVRHNGERIGLSGYRGMLERDFREIPDLSFESQLLIAEPPRIASRLAFDCTPKGKFRGLDVKGKRVSFTENVFYEFRGGKIAEVWSVIDKAAIEAQIQSEE
jgi:predicted ester cyclase/quinol monooxygenase YgiN